MDKKKPAYAVDGLQEDGVGESNLGDPESANNMSPPPIIRLLERTSSIRTKTTLN